MKTMKLTTASALLFSLFGSCGALALDSNRDRLLWHNKASGELSAWVFDSSGAVSGKEALSWQCDSSSGCAKEWTSAGTGDFNDDGVTDVLWHNRNTGELSVWTLGAAGEVAGKQPIDWKCGPDCTKDWARVGNGDFNSDRRTDILWHNKKTGELSAWLINSSGIVGSKQALGWKCAAECLQDWSAIGTGDFNADGTTDVMWHNKKTGELSAWLVAATGEVTGKQTLSWQCNVASGCANSWQAVATGDISRDGVDDILWYNTKSGELSAWLANANGKVLRKQALSWKCETADGCGTDWKVVGEL